MSSHRSNALSLPLPVVPNPHNYTGLFVFDFGTHVSLGYTSAEVAILLTSDGHKNGRAYSIYRVDEKGRFELRGADLEALNTTETICFLRADLAKAREDFDAILKAADQEPLPCDTRLRLTRTHSGEMAAVTTLTYHALRSHSISQWLGRHAPLAGDRVEAGSAVPPNADCIESVPLPCSAWVRTRLTEEVLRHTDKAVQR